MVKAPKGEEVYGGKTLTQIGKEVGLSGITLDRYVEYIKRRRKESPFFAFDESYASEWGERFLTGHEYSASDLRGMRILREIDMTDKLGIQKVRRKGKRKLKL